MSSLAGAVDFSRDDPARFDSATFRCPDTGLLLSVHGRISGEPIPAYRKLGDECPRHILGEYVFALWDPRRQRLLCARDSAGGQSFFYALQPDGSLRFSSNAAALRPDRPALDEASLVDFLLARGALLPGRTPLRDIQRLPPAHTLAFDRSALRVSPYWSVFDGDILFASQAEAVEACADALQDALRDRLSGVPRAAISLSGGWDSAAAFVVWQHLRRTDSALAEPWFYHYYSDAPEGDERPAVRELLRQWPAEGEFAPLDSAGVLTGLDAHCAALGLPEPASGWRWIEQCTAAARAAAAYPIVVGEAGNEVFQSSILRPADLLLSGRPRDAVRQARAWARDADTSVRSYLAPFVVRPAATALFPRLGAMARSFAHPPAALPYLTPGAEQLAQDLIADARARRRRMRSGRSLSSWDKRAALEHWCNELYAIPPYSGWTAPYLDRRVVTVALAALECEPRAGSTRQLLSATVESITGNPFRGHYAHYTGVLESSLRAALAAGSDLFQAPRLVDLGIVDPARLSAWVDSFRAGGSVGLTALWRLLSAETWARTVYTG